MNNNHSHSGDMITISREEYEALLNAKEEVQRLTKVNDWLREQITLAKKKQYGSSSEKADESVYEQLSLLADEPEMIAYLESLAEKDEVVIAEHKRKRRSGKAEDILPEGIPEEIVEHYPEDMNCPECGSPMEIIGSECRSTLKIIPEQVILRKDIYYTVACKKCEDENCKTQIVKTPRDVSVLPGSFASPEAVAHIMTQKYVMGCPLYRQEANLNRRNIMLSRQTMSYWMLSCAERWLEPLYEELHKKLLQEDIIHADETVLQVLKEFNKTPQSNSYMWLYRTGKYAAHPIALYNYQPTRSGDSAQEFLKGFHGYLQTDGYSGYNKVEGVTHVGCLAHLRRKFDEVNNAQSKGLKSNMAVKAEAYCSKIFRIEKSLAELSCEERYTKRLELEVPVLEEFEKFMLGKNAGTKSALGKAVTYYNNQWSTIKNYLLDGRLEVSNNFAERSIKPFVIDRKNFLFANTEKGAKCTAITFSIIETAKENNLDPYKYLVYVFTKAPTTDDITCLLPENAPEECKIST